MNLSGYYDAFPPKAMNVAVNTVDVPDGSGNLMRKKVLVVTKDFDAGELIYKVRHLTYMPCRLSDIILMMLSSGACRRHCPRLRSARQRYPLHSLPAAHPRRHDHHSRF